MEGGRAPENGEVTTEDGQGLAQAVSRPLRIEVRPQERDQLLARLDLAWPHGQIGKQGLSFASPDGDNAPVGRPGLERAEQREVEGLHHISPTRAGGTISPSPGLRPAPLPAVTLR
jgi:hypothetical protein